VRCLEDPDLVDELRISQVPLDICPTSNICLGVFPGFAEHPLPRLIDAGLYVTLNSDDPSMFNTTLTDEYLAAAHTFGFGPDTLEWLVLNGVRPARGGKKPRPRIGAAKHCMGGAQRGGGGLCCPETRERVWRPTSRRSSPACGRSFGTKAIRISEELRW
jgi:hypothetical protein